MTGVDDKGLQTCNTTTNTTPTPLPDNHQQRTVPTVQYTSVIFMPCMCKLVRLVVHRGQITLHEQNSRGIKSVYQD